MFARLIQRSPGSIVSAMEGYAVSIAAHALVIGAVVFGPVDAPSEELPESFEWAKFLLPPDKSVGASGVREHVTYFEAAAPSGSGTMLQDTKEPERLPLDVETGTADDELVEVAAAPPPAPEQKVEEVMTVLEVDTAAARYEDSAAPPYPKSMLDRKIEGSVAVQYVVDTSGRADTSSFVVLETTHADFARSVKSTLPNMRFRPAIMNAQKVRQLVQQLFTFKIDSTALAAPPRKP